ncbi:hypothetical protein, partial [Caulobacter sp. 17J65-9]|uniref:hypothetical protein n=1 Tax=Caulobacter sp. 17J65-9 TaxID=2709382 RepID=UPI0013CA19BD
GGAGDTTRRMPRLGETGVRMCDAALAADTLPAAFDLRRASLLRARALHRLALNDVKGALADLELARAAAGPASRSAFDRSLGVGVDYVQAYALGMAGDTAGARALVRSTFAKRPYSRQSALAALIVADSLDDPAELERAARETARLAPESVDDLFGLLVEQGRWNDALAIWPQLVPPREKDETPYYVEMRRQGDRNYVSAARYWADKGGWRAYALAASGRPAEARAALAEARDRLA